MSVIATNGSEAERREESNLESSRPKPQPSPRSRIFNCRSRREEALILARIDVETPFGNLSLLTSAPTMKKGS